MNKKFYGFAFSALALGMLASCSNDVKNSPAEPNGPGELPAMQLAQAPDLVIWSGSNTLATKAEGDVTTTTNGNKTDKYDYDEVEVNLAIQDVHYLQNGDLKYDIKDLVSHLSIHVRTATDVTVTIPINEQYYCDQDDLLIYAERNVNDWELEQAEHQVSYEVTPDNTVTLSVNFAADGITVSTDGINEDVLAHCKSLTGDGINFDVYNYYIRGNQNATQTNVDWTVASLKTELNNSKVTFDSRDKVEFYINAFTGTFVNLDDPEEGQEENLAEGIVLRDCTVSLLDATNWEEVSFDTEKHPELLNKVWQNKNYQPASTGGVTGGGDGNDD